MCKLIASYTDEILNRFQLEARLRELELKEAAPCEERESKQSLQANRGTVVGTARLAIENEAAEELRPDQNSHDPLRNAHRLQSEHSQRREQRADQEQDRTGEE